MVGQTRNAEAGLWGIEHLAALRLYNRREMVKVTLIETTTIYSLQAVGLRQEFLQRLKRNVCITTSE